MTRKQLENDCSHMDMLRDTVSDFSSALAIHNEQERKIMILSADRRTGLKGTNANAFELASKAICYQIAAC